MTTGRDPRSAAAINEPRNEAFGSGAAPFKVGAAKGRRLRSRLAPAAAAPDVINFRLEISLIDSSLMAPSAFTAAALSLHAFFSPPTAEVGKVSAFIYGLALRPGQLRRLQCSVLPSRGVSRRADRHGRQTAIALRVHDNRRQQGILLLGEIDQRRADGPAADDTQPRFDDADGVATPSIAYGDKWREKASHCSAAELLIARLNSRIKPLCEFWNRPLQSVTSRGWSGDDDSFSLRATTQDGVLGADRRSLSFGRRLQSTAATPLT
jgi:hypothetical protein